MSERDPCVRIPATTGPGLQFKDHIRVSLNSRIESHKEEETVVQAISLRRFRAERFKFGGVAVFECRGSDRVELSDTRVIEPQIRAS